MRVLLSALLLMVGTNVALAQQTISTFQNTKFRVNNYGEYQESSTATPTVITLNIEKNTIEIATESGIISSFLEYNTTQSIRHSEKQGARQWVYVTSEGFIFRIQPAMRQILITKEGTNLRMHALYLDEIQF